MFVDTHAHLYVEKFQDDISAVIARAQLDKVKKFFLPNIDSNTTAAMNELAKAYPDICYPMIGLHPCSVKEDYKKELDHIKEELSTNKYYGIGETGVDLFWDTTFKKQQIEAFEFQIQLAKEYKLPIIIHSRECMDLTIEIISRNQDGNLTGIFHCFNGDIDQCKKIQEIGFMMGLGGVITFKKANLGPMVEYMSEDNLLLETDSPYLAPTPHRGKRNESSYIPIIAQKVAEFRNITIDEVMDFTTRNARNVFDF